MNRKIFAILTLLIVATSITAVSAFDLGDIFGGESKNQTVTISGIDFNIPEGFVEEPTNITNELADTIKQHGVNFNVKGYVKDSTIVGLFVVNYDQFGLSEDMILSLIGGNATKINNVEGFTLVDDGLYMFYYPKDKSIVVISSNDENVIGDFIIA